MSMAHHIYFVAFVCMLGVRLGVGTHKPLWMVVVFGFDADILRFEFFDINLTF